MCCARLWSELAAVKFTMRVPRQPRALSAVMFRRLACSVTGGKSVKTAEEAIKDIPSGAKVLVGGFGLTGVPENLLRALNASDISNLTVVSSNVGTATHGLGPLFASKKISKMIGSYVGENEVRGASATQRCCRGSMTLTLPLRSRVIRWLSRRSSSNSFCPGRSRSS